MMYVGMMMMMIGWAGAKLYVRARRARWLVPPRVEYASSGIRGEIPPAQLLKLIECCLIKKNTIVNISLTMESKVGSLIRVSFARWILLWRAKTV